MLQQTSHVTTKDKPVSRFLGQHFLHDRQLINYWLNTIDPKPGQRIVEIGPGQGALTAPLLKRLPRLDVVELDHAMVNYLQKHLTDLSQLHIHHADALEFDYSALADEPHGLRVVGNLPYQITSPLLFALLQQRLWLQDMHFLLQKDIVQRLAAEPDTANYSRLTVMVQYYCQVQALRQVPPEVFTPPPRVQSQFVRLTPYRVMKNPASDEKLFAHIVKLAFQSRRKTIRNGLKSILSGQTITSVGVDPHKRPQSLTVAEFVQLADAARLSQSKR